MDWPDEYESLRHDVLEEWDISPEYLGIDREFSDGRTSARVFCVDVSHPEHDGQAVLKLDTLKPWHSHSDTEVQKLRQIIQGNNEFTSSHVPSLIDGYQDSKQVAILSTLAGQSMQHVEAFENFNSLSRKKATIEKVSDSILSEWNDNYSRSHDLISPREVLDEWLGYRLDPEEGGNIEGFIEGKLDITINDQSFSVHGKWVPSPLAYSLSNELWEPNRIRLIKGHQHGDLHGRNILVKIEPSFQSSKVSNFYIVDFSLYSSGQNLFYGHSYLELSYLLNNRGGCSIARWCDILNTITTPRIYGTGFRTSSTELSEKDEGLKQVIDSLREPIGEWSQRVEANRMDHMKSQYLLSRVAAGLNFTNKPYATDNVRILSYIYSAYNLKQYLEFSNVDWQKDGKVVELAQGTEPPEHDQWRGVWNYCNHFEKRRNIYVLVTGIDDKIGISEYSILGNIPWSIVFDFSSTSTERKLLNSLRSNIEDNRALHLIESDNVGDINFDRSTSWVNLEPHHTDSEHSKMNYHEWRRGYSSIISKIITQIRDNFKPKRVVFLILADNIDQNKIQYLWENVDGVLVDQAKHAIVSTSDSLDLFRDEDIDNVSRFQLSSEVLLNGFAKMLENSKGRERVRVPRRKNDQSTETTLTILSIENRNYISEDLDIVHYGLAGNDSESEIGTDFWKGHEITWKEINMGVDLERDITSDIKREINTSIHEDLKAENTVFLPVPHKPGAGATTIAKRVAWHFKELYPTVFIKNISNNTAARISELYQVSGRLPIIAIAEAGDIRRSQSFQLMDNIRAEGARCIVLYIHRDQEPSGKLPIDTPLSKDEAEDFFKHYKEFATEQGKVSLNKLMDDKNTKYWSPFFFGFYAFGEEFKRVPDFVSICLAETSERVEKIVQYLALISKYSQKSGLTLTDVKLLLDISTERELYLDTIFDGITEKLIKVRDEQIDIVHPLISVEILSQTLVNQSDDDTKHWKSQLPDFCMDFVKDMVSIMGSESERLKELFTQLFTHRQSGDDFSESIYDLPRVESQHKILNMLTERCSHVPHFWIHLSRHYTYEMQTVPDDTGPNVNSTYDAAKECAQRALEINDQNPDHHHWLGMVFRSEVYHKLSQLLRSDYEPIEALDTVRDIIDRAEKRFEKARDLAPNNEYGFVSCMQMYVSAIDKLFQMSNNDEYSTFLASENQVSTWCVDKLNQAEELLRQIKIINTIGNYSKKVKDCMVEVNNFYSEDIEAVINSLSEKLDQGSSSDSSIRRTITNAYLRRAKSDWSNLNEDAYRKIYNLMDSNLHKSSPRHYDLITWFKAYRRLPEFDIINALDEFKVMLEKGDPLEINYYLYVLYFIQWKKHAIDDPNTVKSYIRRTQRIASKRNLNSTWSHEWFSKNPSWCPLLHHTEQKWDSDKNFFADPSPLRRLSGRIREIKGPQAGHLRLGPFEPFFMPGTKFRPRRDEGMNVDFFVGFSYSGLRAWEVSSGNGDEE